MSILGPAAARGAYPPAPAIFANLPRWSAYLHEKGITAATRQPVWLAILRDGLGHQPYCLEVVQALAFAASSPWLTFRA